MKWKGYIIRYNSSGRYNFSLVSEDGKEIDWKRNSSFSSEADAVAAANCCVDFGDEIVWQEGKKK